MSVSDRNDSAENLGTRPIGRLLWWTCSQTTLSVGVYGIYALTNAWFVARGVGETALAAVNLVAPLLLLLGAVSTTVGVGGASLVSRSLGARRPDLAARAAGNSFAIFWATAVTVTVVGLAFLDPLLRLVGATDETLPYARPYATVIIGGAIFSTGFSALVRAEGRLLFSTMLWVVPVLVQIILDPLLIFGLDLGVVGAGLGTVGGQAVSAGMAVWFFFVQRRRPYRVGLRQLLPHRPTVLSVLAVAGAAYAVCARVQTFVSMPQTGITQGAQPIISFNVGRRQFERVRRARTLALSATVVYGAAAAGVVALAAHPIAAAFLTSPDDIAFTVDALRIIATGFVFAGVSPLISAYFQALGSPAPSYLISVGTLLLLKVPLVLLLGALGPVGIWIALPAGEALAATAAIAVLWWRTAVEAGRRR